MKDCRECKHATRAYSQWLCRVTGSVRPTSVVRDSRSECGPEARRFERANTDTKPQEGRDAGVGA